MQHILDIANQLAQYVPWDAVVWAPVVSPILLLVKKVKDIHNGELMIWLLIAFSGASAALEYMFTTPTNDPTIVAFKGLITMLATQPVYKLLLKPAIAFIGKEIQKAATLNDLKTAAVPATGLAATPAVASTPLNPVTTANMRPQQVQVDNFN